MIPSTARKPTARAIPALAPAGAEAEAGRRPSMFATRPESPRVGNALTRQKFLPGAVRLTTSHAACTQYEVARFGVSASALMEPREARRLEPWEAPPSFETRATQVGCSRLAHHNADLG